MQNDRSRSDPLLSNKPKTRQRVHKAPPALIAPNINDDASERKRVLNVLAQRRYRERKRNGRKAASTLYQERPSQERQDGRQDQGLSREENAGQDTDGAFSDTNQTEDPAAAISSWISVIDDYDTHGGAVSWDKGILDTSNASIVFEHGCLDVASDESGSGSPSTQLLGLADTSSARGPPGSLEPPATVDPMILFRSPPSALSSVDDLGFSFPDTCLLPVPELTTLRAFVRIATRLGCKGSLWDINSTSPFFANPTASTSHLPKTWQPTASQMLVPHHPLLDFLPWPSVREKIINVFTLPEDLRPPSASSPTALVQFAYDLEDNSEGVRIWGDDPYSPGSWEVGQALFERWWFIFDRQIIEQSNRWRGMRGAAKLRITGAAETGGLWQQGNAGW